MSGIKVIENNINLVWPDCRTILPSDLAKWFEIMSSANFAEFYYPNHLPWPNLNQQSPLDIALLLMIDAGNDDKETIIKISFDEMIQNAIELSCVDGLSDCGIEKLEALSSELRNNADIIDDFLKDEGVV